MTDPVLSTAADRPDLFRRANELTKDVWPPYNTHGLFLSVLWPRLEHRFGDYQFTIHDPDTEKVLAQGHSVPAYWDGTLEGLPEGIDEVVKWAFDGVYPGRRMPTSLAGLSVMVPRANRGRGLSRHVIEGMRKIAAAHGLAPIIVPVRPVMKERYPLTPIERYVGWRRADGTAFDPWIRIHEDIGGSILRPAPASLEIDGSIAEWEDWTQMAFPETGEYVIPQGLATVSINIERNLGRYFEPNVWVRHSM